VSFCWTTDVLDRLYLIESARAAMPTSYESEDVRVRFLEDLIA
jgi:hypothetical protein